MIKQNRNVEGYWYNERHPEYPTPIPDELSQQEAERVCFLIKEKERTAKEVRYRGFSGSRITGERLGCNEFMNNEWVWTGDLAKHYVLTHRVKPSEEFLKHIGYYDVKQKNNTGSEHWIC